MSMQVVSLPGPNLGQIGIRHDNIHYQLSPDELLATGATPSYVRLSVGIEHIDDILADLDKGLAAAAKAAR